MYKFNYKHRFTLVSILVASILLCCDIKAQQTVGLFLNSEESYNGYTLFGNNEVSYLIDNCGYIVNSWESEYKPGNSMYLLENGDLLRTSRISGEFHAGGVGGRFEHFNWDGDLLWWYEISSPTEQAHHDIAPLPNGNFLAIVWVKYSQSEAHENGRIINGEVWAEKIVEIRPIGNNQADIVWQWNLWDHLVQENDPSKLNYGIIADNPQLVDINFIGDIGDARDWIHMNSVHYNEKLDQILVSSRSFSEIWIIDHSTTTAEASSHKGGNAGKGGDLLYRFGNPQTYQRGNESDRKFFNQHDARWIPDEYSEEGKLMVFNNNYLSENSKIDIFSPPINDHFHYELEPDSPFGPNLLDWEYMAEGFHSSNMSGAMMLKNGNVLICEADEGRFFEVTNDKELVWEYINPVNRNGHPVLQGGTPQQNQTFRVVRYGLDYPAFEDRIIQQGLPVELAPWESDSNT